MTTFSTTKTALIFVSLLGFGWLSCSDVADTPYDVQDDDAADQAQALAECESQEFLTQACSDVVAAEQDRVKSEQAGITTAKSNLNDFAGCYLYAAAQDEEADATAVVCSDAVSLVLTGFDYCTALAATEKYYECSSIEEAVNTAVGLCDASAEEVTTDFCALVNPTTDETTE